jgi:hypothetical protein
MKLIDADELLSKLTDIKHIHKHAIEKASIYECMYAVRKMEECNSWIPVSERLPEIRQYKSGEPIEFIAMIRGASVPTSLMLTDQDEWKDFVSIYRDNESTYNENYDVVAWMEFPEPYKEDTNV